MQEYESNSDSDTPLEESSTHSSQTNNMSPQQRTEILRECHIKVKELEYNINPNTPRYLEPIVNEADRVNQDGTMEEKIKNSEEVVLDSEIVCTASTIIKKCSANLLKDFSNYDSIEFAEKLMQFVKRNSDTVTEETMNWSTTGKKLLRFFNKTAKFTMLLGTLRSIAKKEVVRRKTVRQAQAPTKRPEHVSSVDKVEDSVEETVNGIKKLIHRYIKHNKKPVDFFSLVLHPTSYGKTIENILHTSFLVRDSFIKFKIDKNGIPFVEECAVEKDEDDNNQNRMTRNIQNVLSLNMHQWKALVDAYGITKPMIDLESKKSKNSK